MYIRLYIHSNMIDYVCCNNSLGTFWNLAASGLNSGVSINYRNKFDSLFLNPSKLLSERPLFNISASLSIKSTISLVKLQSNSLTVHLVCSNTSNLSSVLKNGSLSPLQRSISSLALVLKGVCTSVNLPSLRFHNLGSLIAFKKSLILSSLFYPLAVIFNLSIYCRIFVSLCSNYCNASFFSSSLRSVEFLIFLVSLSLHASNSLYNISKSLYFLGCILRSISTLCFFSSCVLRSSCLFNSSMSLSSLNLRN